MVVVGDDGTNNVGEGCDSSNVVKVMIVVKMVAKIVIMKVLVTW